MANKISVWITYWEKVKKIAVCDCFLDVVIGLIHDGFFSLDKNIQDRVIKKKQLKKQQLMKKKCMF